MIPNQPSDEFSILSARTVLSRTQWKILFILGLLFIVAWAFIGRSSLFPPNLNQGDAWRFRKVAVMPASTSSAVSKPVGRRGRWG